MTRKCNVCDNELGAPVFRSGERFSLTTMNKLVEGETIVTYCPVCDHTQTDELPNLQEFYASEYEINLDSADDDQLYAVIDGQEVYRSDHQAAVLTSKIDLTQYPNVLDYGCAKAATLRKIRERVPGIKAHLYDVTDKYTGFWESFPQPADWAAFTPKEEWKGNIDVLLSFYALEHIPHLGAILEDVKALLRDGGYFYFLVPNVFQNTADFIVADHVNHFSRTSLEIMLDRAGFTDIDIDDTAHAAAFVVMARLDRAKDAPALVPAPDRQTDIADIAGFWGGIKSRIQAFEETLDDGRGIAIYGAGIYGNFILSCLNSPDRVRCFIDQNKYLSGSRIADIPVVHPDGLPQDVDTVLVGLNPRIARQAMQDVPAFSGRGIEFFFLD